MTFRTSLTKNLLLMVVTILWSCNETGKQNSSMKKRDAVPARGNWFASGPDHTRWPVKDISQ